MTEPTDMQDIPEPSADDYEAAADAVRAEQQDTEPEDHDEPSPNDEDVEGQADPDEAIGNEAAKYRKRLRATEGERDALAARVDAMQRSEIERLAAEHMVDPTDFWRDGATVADSLNDDGSVDPAKVAAVASAVLQNHRHWGAFKKVPNPPRGLQSGSSAPKSPESPSWAKQIQAAVGRAE